MSIILPDCGCDAGCIPAHSTDCNTQTLQSGFSRIAFALCDSGINSDADFANETTLGAAIAAGKIRLSPEVVGDIPEAADGAAVQTSSCKLPVAQFLDQTLTAAINVFGTDPNEVIRFINYVNSKRNSIRVLTYDCTGYWRFWGEGTAVTKHTSQGDGTGVQTYTVTFQTRLRDAQFPEYIADTGQFQALLAGASTPCPE
jgi:hypothetical protein